MSKKITIKVRNKELNALESLLTTEHKNKKKLAKDMGLALSLFGKLIHEYDKEFKK